MSQGIFCDLIVFMFDVLQGLVDIGFIFYDLLGLPAFNLREQLNIGSIFGCNL